jgi:hypothetical protein
VVARPHQAQVLPGSRLDGGVCACPIELLLEQQVLLAQAAHVVA